MCFTIHPEGASFICWKSPESWLSLPDCLTFLSAFTWSSSAASSRLKSLIKFTNPWHAGFTGWVFYLAECEEQRRGKKITSSSRKSCRGQEFFFCVFRIRKSFGQNCTPSYCEREIICKWQLNVCTGLIWFIFFPPFDWHVISGSALMPPSLSDSPLSLNIWLEAFI